MTRPAALYIRVSNHLLARDDRYGLARQEAEGRAYAARQGFTIPEGALYTDIITGRSETRKGLEQLKAEAGRYSAIITSEADRLGRTPLAGHKILDELLGLGLQVHNAVDGWYNPEDDSSVLTYDVRMLLAHQELRQIKRRMLGGKLAAAEKGGIIPHHWRCYGYREVFTLEGGRPVRRIEVDEAEAEIVREIFRRLVGGETTGKIADDLNARGVPSPMNAIWHLQRVWYIAQNTAYKGEARMTLRHAKREFIFAVPALVDADTWQLARDSLRRKPKKHTDIFWLNGILRCAECGGAMSGTNTQSNRTSYRHYRCSRAFKHRHYGDTPTCSQRTHYRMNDLHAHAERIVREIAEHPERYMTAAAPPVPDHSRTLREIERLEGQLKRYLADYQRELLTGDEYAGLRDAARQQIEALRAQMAPPPVVTLPNMAATLEAIGRLVREGVPTREVLLRSGTRLSIAPGGVLEVVLRV
ncbi:recombinase family protein [Deinococcus sp. YIM 77859]|uniref:recombinase family protein n=1 Tax=Deinococcus sp. YIM 77859 TaxID=1540221 RepID=UPI000550FE7E|nr:recombinase family protein [Deinococcus sp. YIM 77859]